MPESRLAPFCCGDLDHSRATLLVRRTRTPLHTVYLDELAYRLARQ